jgi:tetratricopeptide (TPR) repeat protein
MIWQSRPIFITSTFRDLHAERDWLRTHVFPELAERLSARLHHLEIVDLRWGVDSSAAGEEESREQLVLKVCLGEIERCRPFLVGLLGDRYGWCPPPDRLRAAAEGAGYSRAPEGRSVTELEILHGVLESEDQRHRSWFYFRDPLPYDRMPPEIAARYSEAHSGAADAAERARRLEALKKRLEKELPGRVRRFRAEWDTETQEVRGLESWGRQVLEDLWSDLEAETAAYLHEAPERWELQDSWTLETFVERQASGFVGRAAVVAELIAAAMSPVQGGGPWATCVAGEPGLGKSSIFARLHRELQKSPVLLLSHAAGTGPSSTIVDRMLRRFVRELADALGDGVPLDESAGHEEVEREFASLLRRASARRRVVVLIDALDQFEQSARARHLTWLPEPWPENARLVVTSAPGSAASALGKRSGTQAFPLRPMDHEEAREIVRSICARHHRSLDSRVIDALLSRRRADGNPAYGNPLWLCLATDELNLLDEDDFERAERDFAAIASPYERIVRMLLAVTADMPPDVEGLYGWVLDRSQRLFGKHWAASAAELIALSRSGWREADLERLLPAITREPWDPLRFARFRRLFGPHLAERGAYAQWDFTHRQLRVAVERRLDGRPDRVRLVHGAIAGHALSLGREDPLHESETMYHLVRSGDAVASATYLGAELTAGELAGAIASLSAIVIEAASRSEQESAARASVRGERATETAAALSDVTSLLDAPIADAPLGRVCSRIIVELNEVLLRGASVQARADLLEAATRAAEAIALRNPEAPWCESVMSCGYDRLARARVLQGDLDAARRALHRALAVFERHAQSGGDDPRLSRNFADTLAELATVLVAQGETDEALAYLRRADAELTRVRAGHPNDPSLRRSAIACHTRIGDALAARDDYAAALPAYRDALAIVDDRDPRSGDCRTQCDLLQIHVRIGRVSFVRGETGSSLDSLRSAAASGECLVARDPENPEWMDNLSSTLAELADVHFAREEDHLALETYERAAGIVDVLCARDPANTRWMNARAMLLEKLGAVLRSQESLDASLARYREALSIRERLVSLDPGNTVWQRDLVSHRIAVSWLLEAKGDLAAAFREVTEAERVAGELLRKEPGNDYWLGLGARCERSRGDLHRRQGHWTEALAAYTAAREALEKKAARTPGATEWDRELALVLERIGDALLAKGDSSGAREHFQRGLAVYRGLAARDATHLLWQHDVAVSLSKNGWFQMEIGDLEGAAESFLEAVSINERILSFDPDRARWLNSIAADRVGLGDLATARTEHAAATAEYSRALEINRRLASGHPDRIDWQRNLATTLERLGSAAYKRGDLDAAIQVLGQSVSILEDLAGREPTDAPTRLDLAGARTRAAVVLTDLGHIDEALDELRTAIELTEPLLDRLTRSDIDIRELISRHIATADRLQLPSRSAAAVPAYRFARDVTARLADRCPEDIAVLHDVAAIDQRIGDAEASAGALTAALESYRAALATMQRVTLLDPDSDRWQLDLSLAHHRVADGLMTEQEPAAALPHYREAVAIMEGVATRSPADARSLLLFALSLNKLAGALWSAGDRDAVRLWIRCRDLLRRHRACGGALDPRFQELADWLDGSPWER